MSNVQSIDQAKYDGDLARAVQTLLRMADPDPEREGLSDTPRRFVRMLNEMTRGYRMLPEGFMTTFDSEGCDEMVTVGPIPFYSLCEHHLAPFHGNAWVAYVPNGRIVGLSKIPRLVEMYAKRLQVQERMTNQIADAMVEQLDPVGVAVLVRARHLCYSSDTEILTDDGWVRFDSLREGSLVMQADPQTLQMSLVQPSRIIREPHVGELLHFQGKSIDLLVTPDHRMLVRSEWGQVNAQPWHWAPAHVAASMRCGYMPVAGAWRGVHLAEHRFGERRVPGDWWAEFLGLFLAEGSTSGGKVRITQHPDHHRPVLDLLTQADVAVSVNEKNITLREPGLLAQLAPFGRSGDKFVPAALKAATVSQIERFLTWYRFGDGNDRRLVGEPGGWHYVSKSRRLIDDVQELELRCGAGATVLDRGDHYRANTRHLRESSEPKGHARFAGATSVPYVGDVYCVTVPSGAVVVRRNGKPTISGNCMEMRGVRSVGAETRTTALRGAMLDKPEARAEFLAAIHG